MQNELIKNIMEINLSSTSHNIMFFISAISTHDNYISSKSQKKTNKNIKMAGKYPKQLYCKSNNNIVAIIHYFLNVIRVLLIINIRLTNKNILSITNSATSE